jgi:hypothetical protein
MKPRVAIKEVLLFPKFMMGVPTGHPDRTLNGITIRTSTIVSRDLGNRTVETENTIYTIEGDYTIYNSAGELVQVS